MDVPSSTPANVLLRQERIRRNWRQQDVADQLGTTAVTVKRWERGSQQPGAYYRVKLCALFGKSAEELGLVAVTPSPLTTTESEATGAVQIHSPFTQALTLWTVPYQRNPHFTGRDDLLDRLDQQLLLEKYDDTMHTRRAALTQPQAIKGLGGIGKTQIALEYAYRAQERGLYTHTFWINAASEEALITSFVTIAGLLPAFAAKDETDQRTLVMAVKRWLEQCQQRWLLIFDNADDLALAHEYLPQSGNGSILLTTRANAVASIGISLEVETMSFIEGTHLLLRRAQRFEHATDEEINEAGNIVVALDHFPLALDQAGAYIEETNCRFSDYLTLYQKHRRALLARRGTQITHYPDSVATTWSLSLQKVGQANPAAAEFLQLCAFLAPHRIPAELIRDGAAHWSPLLQQAASDLFTFNEMIAELLKFSLIKRLAEDNMFSIHSLVQAVQADRMDADKQCYWAERIVYAVNEIFPRNPKDEITSWPLCLRYLEQVQACDMLIQQYSFVFSEAADLLNRTGIYLHLRASYNMAEPLYQKVLGIWEQVLGREHPQVASALNELAHLYHDQGKHVEAGQLYQRALQICEQHQDSEHLQLAVSLNGLAYLYQEQGKYSEAELLYQRALAVRKQHLGPEHPEVAATLNGLAYLYQEQGKYGEAEPLYQRALWICEQRLGPEHPEVARPLNNLAYLYHQQSRYVEAEPLYQRALRICEQQVGQEHPLTAYLLNNLANLYHNRARYVEAEPLYQRTLAIREQHLGPIHANLVYPLSNLAVLYHNRGKYAEAELLYQRALRICEQSQETENSAVAYPLYSLAVLYHKQGLYANAEPLYLRSLAIREQQFGREHPDVAYWLAGLANLYRDQSKYADAELLYLQALHIQDQALGLEHPDVAYSLDGLALLYSEQGKYADAEPLYQRALHIWELQLGPEHPNVATSLNGLANLYRDQGKYVLARPLLLRALHIRERYLGLAHPETSETMHSIALLQEALRNGLQARIWYAHALTIREQAFGAQHPKTAETRKRFIALLHAIGQHEQASQLEILRP